jgi:glyoxylase-like metal-dependent hydrolase (beta-lactamase superfamily II)
MVPIQCYHLALDGRSVLVDAGEYIPPQDDPAPSVPGNQARSLLDQLKAAQVDPVGVDAVIITHAHHDHFNALTHRVGDRYVPLFPRAAHYLGAGDWQPDRFTDLEKNTLMVVKNQGLLSLVGDPLDLGDGLMILPAPGESPGHQILRVQAGDQEYDLAGDLYHHPLEFEDISWNVQWAESNVNRGTKAALMGHAAESGALFYFTHVVGLYRVNRAGSNLRWQPV